MFAGFMGLQPPVSPRAYSAHTSKRLNTTLAAPSRNLSAAASALKNAETPDEGDKITLEDSICDVLIFSKWTWILCRTKKRILWEDFWLTHF